MKTVEIFDDEHSILIDDSYDTTNFTFYSESKTFKVRQSVKDDVFYSNQTMEYKVSVDPIELKMRTLESSHEPPLEYSIKDGVVLESAFKKDGIFSRLEDLKKKEVEWSTVSLLGNFEVNLYILSLHPEIISRNEYRKFLRETEQRIKIGIAKVEEQLKIKDKTGLQILEGEYGKQIWYSDAEKLSEAERDKKFQYVDKDFYEPLFEEKSQEYSGISRHEFQTSPSLLKHIDKLLNEKDGAIQKGSSTAEKKSLSHWFSYAWTIVVNLITIGVVLAIYDQVYENFETIAVSILILIYLSIQSFSMTYGHTITTAAFGLDTEFKRIRKLLKDEPNKIEKEGIEKAQKKVNEATIKMFINASFLLIIYLIALFQLFGAL